MNKIPVIIENSTQLEVKEAQESKIIVINNSIEVIKVSITTTI